MLARKSPKDAVNSFKLKFINSVLNNLFGSKNKPFEEFEIFSDDELPTNSDATFIISQYIECAEKFRADNIRQSRGMWWWRIEGKSRPTIRTAAPKKIFSK